jgi:hypothetical protein
MEPEVTPSTPEVVKPEVDSYEQHIEWQRSDFSEFFNCAMTNIWNARDRLLLKGMAGYIGPFLEIYSIMYDACPDNRPLERELWDRSDKVLTTITGNGPALSYLEDKEDERFRADEEDESDANVKLLANAEKLVGIILEFNKAQVKAD